MSRKLSLYLAIFLLIFSCSRPKSDKINLQFWQFWTDPQVKPTVLKLIQKFEQENPDIKLELTDLTWANGHEKIVVAFASNSAPDVLELGSDWVPEFSSQNVLLDLTSAVDSIKDRYRMWEPGIFGENIFAFPWILDTRVLFYNKDLMKKAGLDPDHPPQTWSKLLSYAKKTNQPQRQKYGFGANAAERHRLYKKFLPFLWGNDGKILSDDNSTCLINSKEVVDALKFYIELTKFGLLDTQRRLDEAFMQGKIGFLISGGWLLREIQKNNLSLNFGVTLMPKPDINRGTPASFAGGEFLVINKKTKYPQETLKWIRFLTRLDNCLELCKAIGTPSPSDTAAIYDTYYQNNPYLKIFQEQLKYSFSPPATPKWVYIEEKIEKAIEEAMYGRKTPQQALEDAKKEIDKLMKS
ncbi:MAG: hypothetical protein A2145_03785 [candidate division Zixibacteria bacterium RBG_16_40_9]|nr:MAG: hypothetical protein A2145_03785 [candidate division Zixibacteria bacterium RBG_16_40_9]